MPDDLFDLDDPWVVTDLLQRIGIDDDEAMAADGQPL